MKTGRAREDWGRDSLPLPSPGVTDGIRTRKPSADLVSILNVM